MKAVVDSDLKVYNSIIVLNIVEASLSLVAVGKLALLKSMKLTVRFLIKVRLDF